MDLLFWQKRLSTHFTELKTARSKDVGTNPIFALEHGLNHEEREQLKRSIHDSISHSPPSNLHRLPWVVYAAEVGYAYSGDEYWQTFEEKTPNWLRHGDRNTLRDFFKDFANRFGGVKPAGRWATHFTIICWPITHAILPLDLQRQLAKILFEVRHSITAKSLESPQNLGELIASRSWGASSRFCQFAEDPLLIGQIATALLLHGREEASSLILPGTLSRITKDLENERIARAWMRGARDSLKWSVSHGPRKPGAPSGSSDAGTRIDVSDLDLRILLRSNTENNWDAFLEIPDLSRLLLRFPEFQHILVGSRCVVKGSNGRPLARGRVLYGKQLIRLEDWPQSDTSLLSFENAPEDFNSLIKTLAVLRPRDTWLFKVSSDGTAYLINNPSVRPGSTYIVVRPTCVAKVPVGERVNVSCQDLNAFKITIPTYVDTSLSAKIAALGLSQSCNLLIRPAGFAPAKWDGVGLAEWLSTDNPCIEIKTDHTIGSLFVTIDEQITSIEVSNNANAIFVQLPPLKVGKHCIKVIAKSHDLQQTIMSDPIDVIIRETKLWNHARNDQSPLYVVTDPYQPTMEDLWSGNSELHVYGETGRQLNTSLKFIHKNDVAPFLTKSLPALPLPVTNTEWQKKLETQVKRDPECQTAYDLAGKIRLTFDAGNIGGFSVTFYREFLPFRWCVYFQKGKYFLRLVDDTDMMSQLQITMYSFKNPDIPIVCDPNQALAGKGLQALNGLYVASTRDSTSSVIVPPEVHSLADLKIEPVIKTRNSNPKEIIDLIELYKAWASARLCGNFFCISAKEKVVQLLHAELVRLICGNKWLLTERQFGESKPRSEILRALSISAIGPALGALILRDISSLMALDLRNRIKEFAKIGRDFCGIRDGKAIDERRRVGGSIAIVRKTPDGPGNSVWLAEFALRLATQPETAIDWAGSFINEGLQKLQSRQSFLCCARAIAVFSSHANRTPDPGNSNHWDWK